MNRVVLRQTFASTLRSTTYRACLALLVVAAAIFAIRRVARRT
jgi:hypothetical protein